MIALFFLPPPETVQRLGEFWKWEILFLTASAEERAKRRQTQLKRQGLEVNMRSLLQELEERDRKDTEREHSPLIPAEDSVIIDTSNLNPEGVVKEIKTYL